MERGRSVDGKRRNCVVGKRDDRERGRRDGPRERVAESKKRKMKQEEVEGSKALPG